MRTGLSTHRAIQLSILLENLESKTRMGHRGVKLMTSIKNVAGAYIFAPMNKKLLSMSRFFYPCSSF
jgi:hypothetical protein